MRKTKQREKGERYTILLSLNLLMWINHKSKKVSGKNFQSDIEKIFLPPEIASLLETFVEVESRGLKYERTLIDDFFASFIEFVQNKLEKYNIPRVYVSANLLFEEFNLEPEFSGRVEFQNYIEIEPSELIIRDTDGYTVSVNVKNGNAYIESDMSGTVCIEGLNATDMINFIKEASKEIEKQISRYSISEEDRKVLDAIKNVLYVH